MKEKKVTKEEMLLRLASLCARSEQCAFDLERKLRLKLSRTGEVRWVIKELKERGFLNEERYARALAHDKVAFSGWGKQKIKVALAAKKIPHPYVVEALNSIDDAEYAEAAHRVALAKARSLDLSLRQDLIKLYRHLLSRGFESALALKTMRAVQNEIS